MTTDLLVPVGTGEIFRQKTHLTVHKFITPDLRADEILTLEELYAHCGSPEEILEKPGNLLMFGGASAYFELLMGTGFTPNFASANANIGVGDSTTTEAATQTDLQAATNKFRQSATAAHTDGTASGNASATWTATFATGSANFAWQEWAIFNAASTGRMLNRKVVSLGTKTSAQSWVATATLTLA